MKIYLDSNILLKLMYFSFDLISSVSELGTPIVTSHVASEIRYWPEGSLEIFLSKKHLIKFEDVKYYTRFDHFILSQEIDENSVVCTLDANLMRAAHSRGIKVLTLSKNRRIILYKAGNLSFDSIKLIFK